MKQSDLNHLRRLLGWIRCDIGQAPGEMVQTMIDVAGKLGNPEISPEAQGRLMESYRRAEAVPIYVRDAVKALEKVVAATGRQGPAAAGAGRRPGAETARATAKPAPMLGLTLVLPLGASRRWTTSRLRMAWQRLGFTPGARGQRTGLPEPNMPLAFCVATSNLAAEHSENEASAAAAPLQNHPNAAAYPAACRDTPAAPHPSPGYRVCTL